VREEGNEAAVAEKKKVKDRRRERLQGEW